MAQHRTAAWALLALLVCACSGSAQPVPGPTTAARCGEPIVGPLPVWARAGFSPPDQPTSYFLGAAGRMVGVAFGWPLRATQPAGRNNKILWVATSAGRGPLQIIATREGSGETVTRQVAEGPGPSVIDMPTDGCWRFDLRWPGGSDRMYVRYGDAG